MRVQFAGLLPKPVVVAGDQSQGSSDGGAILLRAADLRLRLTAHLATSVDDRRQPGKVAHELEALLAQRVYGIACGYADANDAARLAHDPIHKLLVGRDPLAGAALASQPTLSRFENAVDAKDLYRMGAALADRVIERHRRRLHGRAKRITIDLDPTDDPTHGAQQLTFWNGHYDTWCYLPIVGFLSFNNLDFRSFLTSPLKLDRFIYAARARISMRPSVIFGESGCELEFAEIRSRHKARRSAASASTNDGVHFCGYQGKAGHDGFVPYTLRYHNQIAA